MAQTGGLDAWAPGPARGPSRKPAFKPPRPSSSVTRPSVDGTVGIVGVARNWFSKPKGAPKLHRSLLPTSPHNALVSARRPRPRLDRVNPPSDLNFLRAGDDVVDFVLGVGLLGHFSAGVRRKLPVDLGCSPGYLGRADDLPRCFGPAIVPQGIVPTDMVPFARRPDSLGRTGATQVFVDDLREMVLPSGSSLRAKGFPAGNCR